MSDIIKANVRMALMELKEVAEPQVQVRDAIRRLEDVMRVLEPEVDRRPRKTVTEIIAESEVAFPSVKGQSISVTYRMMENRQKWMRDNYGDMPWLNDED